MGQHRNVHSIPVTITVAGGTGTTDFNAWGELVQTVCRPPNGGGKYQYEILDANSVIRYTPAKKVEKNTVNCKTSFLENGTYTFRIFDTTNNGTWNIQVLFAE